MLLTSQSSQTLKQFFESLYFKNVGWEESWVTMAKGIMWAEFNHKYVSMEVAEPPESQEACFAFNSDIIFSSLISKGIIFDEHIQQSSCTLGLSKIFVQDDLDRYLPTLKTLRIPFHSGMNINIFILTSIAWLWTIFQSQVSFCDFSCQFSSGTEMKL